MFEDGEEEPRGGGRVRGWVPLGAGLEKDARGLERSHPHVRKVVFVENLAGKSNGDGVFRMPVMSSELGNFSCWQKIQFQDSHPHVSNVVFVEILIFGGKFK